MSDSSVRCEPAITSTPYAPTEAAAAMARPRRPGANHNSASASTGQPIPTISRSASSLGSIAALTSSTSGSRTSDVARTVIPVSMPARLNATHASAVRISQASTLSPTTGPRRGPISASRSESPWT